MGKKKKWEKYFDEQESYGEDIFSNPEAMDAFIASVMGGENSRPKSETRSSQRSKDVESFILDNAIGGGNEQPVQNRWGKKSENKRSRDNGPRYISNPPIHVETKSVPTDYIAVEYENKEIPRIVFSDYIGNRIVVPIVRNDLFGTFADDSLENLISIIADYAALSMTPFCIYKYDELVERFSDKGIGSVCESRFCFLALKEFLDFVLVYYIPPKFLEILQNIISDTNHNGCWEGTLELAAIQLSKMDNFHSSVSESSDIDVMAFLYSLYESEYNEERKDKLEELILDDPETVSVGSSEDDSVLIEMKEDLMSGISYHIASFITEVPSAEEEKNASSVEEPVHMDVYEENSFDNPTGYYTENTDIIVDGGVSNDDDPFRNSDAINTTSGEGIPKSTVNNGGDGLSDNRECGQTIEVVQETTTTNVRVTEGNTGSILRETKEETKEEKEVREYMVRPAEGENNPKHSAEEEQEEEEDSLVINTIRV